MEKQPFENPFDAKGYWLKGNCHLHTTASDGVESAAGEAKIYGERGYDFLVVTDHNCFAEELPQPDGCIMIPGVEVHPVSGGIMWHIVALGGAGAPDTENMTPQETVDVLRRGGAQVVCAHPYWCGLSEQMIADVSGFLGLEVFNTICDQLIGKGDSRYVWDQLLARGIALCGFAVDDTHGKRAGGRFGGWVMVKASEKTPDAILDALSRGRFFSTQGPLIADFRVENGEAVVSAPNVREVFLMANGHRGLHQVVDEGKVVCEARWPLAEGSTYVRAEVVDERGRRAWTNPIFLRKTEEAIEAI